MKRGKKNVAGHMAKKNDFVFANHKDREKRQITKQRDYE
jgi:hypothetical protein